jgi:Fe-S cluster biogenesis protein NfuA
MSDQKQNSLEVDVRVQSTPNPNAWKFILDRPVMLEGKATFSTQEECFGNRLAIELLQIESVKQVHFFANVITITHRFDADVEQVVGDAIAIIQTRLPVHDPHFTLQSAKKDSRKDLPQELQDIEEILDRTIRPGLQGDGGDIEVIRFEDNKLYVTYQGACGTCPSSTTGTLMAIEGILREEYNPAIEVIPL